MANPQPQPTPQPSSQPTQGSSQEETPPTLLRPTVGWAEKPKMWNINLNQMGSKGTHKNNKLL